MIHVLRGSYFTEPVNWLQALATTTYLQPTGVDIPEEQKQGPSHKFIFWGVRWIAVRKATPDYSPYKLKECILPAITNWGIYKQVG